MNGNGMARRNDSTSNDIIIIHSFKHVVYILAYSVLNLSIRYGRIRRMKNEKNGLSDYEMDY